MFKQYHKHLYITTSIIIIAVLVLLGINAKLQKTNSQNPGTDQNQSTNIDWGKVGQAMGKAGEQQPGGVYKISLPRSDLQVYALGVQLKPGFALGTHIEFMQTGSNNAMAMGDLVLTENEVSPVMQKLEQSGIEISALHNHLLGETPRIMYMHIMAKGNPVDIAQAIHNALALTGTPFSPASPTPQNNAIDLNTQQLDQNLGYQGSAKNGVYQYSIPRPEKIMDQGKEIPPAMGVATAINFQPTGNGTAIVTGDFVLKAEEVNSVIKTLTDNNIQVTAVHSHSLTEQPRLFYLHFLAKDDAVKLSQTLRLALNAIH